MKQSNPKLTKINYIAQVSKNLVGQNGTKLTKVTGTQSTKMERSGAKWSKMVGSSYPKLTRTWQNLLKLTKMDQWNSER